MRLSPRSTAPTSRPMAMAKSAGSTPRSTSTAHQAIASGPSRLGKTEKNLIWSFESKRFEHGRYCPLFN